MHSLFLIVKPKVWLKSCQLNLVAEAKLKEDANICCSIDLIPHLEEQFDEETQHLVKEDCP